MHSKRSRVARATFVLAAFVTLLSCPFGRPSSARAADRAWPADFTSWDRITSVTNPLEDPGPRPTFDPAEYARYAKPGTGEVSGYVSITTQNATYHCGWSNVELVPATNYTIWLDLRVAQIARETENPRSAELFFGALPAWMQPAKEDALADKGVVHTSGCDDRNGFFKFLDVPFGNYILVMDMTIHYTSIYHGSESVDVTTADGRPGWAVVDKDEPMARFGDSFFIGVPYLIEVTPDKPRFGIPSKYIGAYAHMHSWGNYRDITPLPTL